MVRYRSILADGAKQKSELHVILTPTGAAICALTHVVLLLVVNH